MSLLHRHILPDHLTKDSDQLLLSKFGGGVADLHRLSGALFEVAVRHSLGAMDL